MRRIIFIVCLLLIVGCSTHKQTISAVEPVVLNNKDSVRVETIIETVYVPMTADFNIPSQSEMNVTANDSSHLETDFAVSNAWIINGILHHNLNNKSGSIKGDVLVPQTNIQTNKEAVIEREVPVPKPYPVEIERKLTLMQQFKLSSFWYLVTAVFVSVSYILRKPLLRVLRKIIRL